MEVPIMNWRKRFTNIPAIKYFSQYIQRYIPKFIWKLFLSNIADISQISFADHQRREDFSLYFIGRYKFDPNYMVMIEICGNSYRFYFFHYKRNTNIRNIIDQQIPLVKTIDEIIYFTGKNINKKIVFFLNNFLHIHKPA